MDCKVLSKLCHSINDGRIFLDILKLFEFITFKMRTHVVKSICFWFIVKEPKECIVEVGGKLENNHEEGETSQIKLMDEVVDDEIKSNENELGEVKPEEYKFGVIEEK